MRLPILAPCAALALAAGASAQTELLLRFERPGGPLAGWGAALVDVGDLDGDGAHDLAVGRLVHGGGEIATVHSARTGALLFRLEAAPVPMFLGDALAPIGDETGDGRAEIAAVGGSSGHHASPDGRLYVYSGADGALLRQLDAPAGWRFLAHGQADVFSPGDRDGDGVGDLYVRATPASGGPSVLALVSGADGALLQAIEPPRGGSFVGRRVARLDDHDGDGVGELALVARVGALRSLRVHSGASGALLAEHVHANLDVVTGNGEPVLAVADLDGDGLRDLAIGQVFGGMVALHSSASGAELRRFGCDALPIPCFGSALVELSDFSGDGAPDLVALESMALGTGLSLFGLAPAERRALRFERFLPDLQTGYASSDRVRALPGADPRGAPGFALFEDLTGSVALMRVVEPLGKAR